MPLEAGPMQRVRPHFFGRAHDYTSKLGLNLKILLGSPPGNHQSHDPSMPETAGPNESSPPLLIILYN